MKRYVSVCTLSVLLCVTAPLVHAARDVPMAKFENEIILNTPSQGAEKIVHDAIVAAAAKKAWDVVSDDGKTVRLSITVRNKHRVVVDVRIRGNAVAVDYVSSFNMGYRAEGRLVGKNGYCEMTAMCPNYDGPTIHSHYGKWISGLLEAAREAALN